MVELIVLLKEKNELGESAAKYIIDSKDNLGHLDGCISFNEEYDVGIEDMDKMTSYQASNELAKLGYPNIHVENRNMLIYLPRFLSDEQNNWFMENKGILSKFKLHILSIQFDNSVRDLSMYNVDGRLSCNVGDLKKELKRKEFFKQSLEETKDIKKM